MNYNEPVKEIGLSLELISRDMISNSPFQREESSALVNKLVSSVSHGFLVPLLVVYADNHYEVFDGQHRLRALDKVLTPPFQVPCVVCPESFRRKPLFYNIEKTDNIRDIATKVYNLYTQTSFETEKDIGTAVLYTPSNITLAFAYIEYAVSSPSLIQSTVKKLDKDFFTQTPKDEALELRREMGSKARDLEDCVYDTAKTYNIKDFNLRQAILSKSAKELWGSKRNIDEDFHEGIDKVIETIKNTSWSWMSGR